MASADVAAFEQVRPTLLGLAYRILGSVADAEDAVQDTFLKWRQADVAAIENPAAWLTTAVTRRAIDMLRAAHRARVEYVGVWLPEPIQTPAEATAEEDLMLASSLQTAFLLLLERLTPKERAAYLLHEVFDVPYPEVARILDMQEAACRQLVSRARGHVEQGKARHTVPRERQEELLAAFRQAMSTGRPDALAALLSHRAELHADGGGKVPAAPHVLHGPAEIIAFLTRIQPVWMRYAWRHTDINGVRGAIVAEDGKTAAALSFAYDEAGRIGAIYIMRNPDKLGRLADISVI